MSWQEVSLGELEGTKGSFVDGPFGSNLKAIEYTDTGIPLIQLKNIKPNQYLPKDLKYVSVDKAQSLSRHNYQAGDVCIAKLGAVGTACIIPDNAPSGIIVADVVRFRGDKSRIDYKYLCHFLNSDMGQRRVLSFSRGSTRTRTNLGDLKKVTIPLPPLDEQKRIAAILDKADLTRQKRKQAITLADEFLRSVFLEMFGDPVTNPKGWSRKEIKEGVSRITSGWSAKGDSRPCGQGEVGVLKISAVTSGEFKPKENKFVEKHIIPEGKNLIFPKKGDLLFSRANTRELVAATCIVPKDCDDVFLPDKLWNIELSSEELMPEYFHMLLQDDKFKETLTSQATGSSGSMLNISKQKFETTLAPFAPIDLQMKFKNIYWQLKDNAAKMKNSEDYLIEQFNALSQKAFSGQL
ncbi:restriction endonuclease subunit S [Vibrio cholerae]|nr:restriction endonuclease subunit S [Vibrio cholerae]